MKASAFLEAFWGGTYLGQYLLHLIESPEKSGHPECYLFLHKRKTLPIGIEVGPHKIQKMCV